MTHRPVLLKEVIEYLQPKKGDFLVDGTVGGGGHMKVILECIGKNGKLLGIDWDKENIEKLKKEFQNYHNLILVHGNYADLPEILEEYNLGKIDGLFLDLGFLSDQLERGRGLSFLKDEILDMRYDVKEGMMAVDVINTFSERDLADIFWLYGEEKYSRKIAAAIVAARKQGRIERSSSLIEIIKSVVPRNYERGRLHPATRVFQALRIFVNQELENLETCLDNVQKIINYKGRLVIISFHSLEDRLVKEYFRNFQKNGQAQILTKKVVRASREELLANPRSRSAKLRALVWQGG
jgi:16S rRNA (cytosine1402-N4)-methyltransferase